ncbi:dihydrofolate reductase [Aureibacter tunicatorum]|uniref:Dihydrofolate reductase n=1 Tax=Aureibacter tunicatorum TaxID=866807 RepID=A0AAE4BUL6_9BACT|nr:dihydrofolate reductase [Aureibacter tunicatorum]MDR6240912.1 dihydrofolate reductase [Aureibacter tunicatorum]BDD03692.1 dihydrofolate reductase [Aureibacter tunicatorum]
MRDLGKVDLKIVVAKASNNVIGKDNELIWHLPADLKHFKKVTMGGAMLMGRKTFESIGRPLPGRLNVVITRNEGFEAEGCIVVKSIDEGVKASQQQGYDDIYVIGGGNIYAQTLSKVNTIYLTEIDGNFEGDVYFPELELSEWNIEEREDFQPDDKNKHAYSFLKLVRKG